MRSGTAWIDWCCLGQPLRQKGSKMSNARFEFNEKGIQQIAQDAVNKLAAQHQDVCIICNKPIHNDGPLEPGMVPVHPECAKKEGLA
jgi:hypothetical protein